MGNSFTKCSILVFILSLVTVSTITSVAAQEGLLDGKVFVGQYREKHKGAVEKDELRFANGEFDSNVYSQMGFKVGEYTSRAEKDTIYFEAKTVSQKQGVITWGGKVRGDSIEVSYRWSKKGWLSDTVKNYMFSGTLKK